MKTSSTPIFAIIALSLIGCAQSTEINPAPEPTVATEAASEPNATMTPNESPSTEAKAEEDSPAPSKPSLGLPSRCLEPRTAGRCKARFAVFGFDPLKGQCVQYFYGGCEGSGNRFDTIEACNEACNPTSTQAQLQ